MPWKVGTEETEFIQTEIQKLGVRCEKAELDLSLPHSVVSLLDEVESTLGCATILVNNAPYSTQTGIDSLSAAELDKHYAVNLRATALLALEFVRRFRSEKSGRIINLT